VKIGDRIAFVTSGATGTGRAVCCAPAARGIGVGFFSGEEELAAEACAAIEGRGVEALAVAIDVRDESWVRAGVDQVVNARGTVDVLSNSVGRTTPVPVKA
jgi:NAD(P)-dependent dehydrogenase (short-subunit alcohol dehydrogenase family)